MAARASTACFSFSFAFRAFTSSRSASWSANVRRRRRKFFQALKSKSAENSAPLNLNLCGADDSSTVMLLGPTEMIVVHFSRQSIRSACV